MFTDTNALGSNTLLNAGYLNADARNNINAVFSLSTSVESGLNPILSTSIGCATTFPIDTLSVYGGGFVLGALGVENSSNVLGTTNTEWRIAISYTMATNSNLGTSLQVHTRQLGCSGRSAAPSSFASLQYAVPTVTDQGRYFHVSDWYPAPTNQANPVYEFSVNSVTDDYPTASFSKISITIQARDYLV